MFVKSFHQSHEDLFCGLLSYSSVSTYFFVGQTVLLMIAS